MLVDEKNKRLKPCSFLNLLVYCFFLTCFFNLFQLNMHGTDYNLRIYKLEVHKPFVNCILPVYNLVSTIDKRIV